MIETGPRLYTLDFLSRSAADIDPSTHERHGVLLVPWVQAGLVNSRTIAREKGLHELPRSVS